MRPTERDQNKNLILAQPNNQRPLQKPESQQLSLGIHHLPPALPTHVQSTKPASSADPHIKIERVNLLIMKSLVL